MLLVRHMHAKAGEPPSPPHSLLVVVVLVVVVVAGVLFGLELVAIGNLVSNSVLKVWCARAIPPSLSPWFGAPLTPF